MTDSLSSRPVHLSEEQRQRAADGTLAPELQRDVDEHLRVCETCAADVGDLKTLMSRIRTSRAAPPQPAVPVAELWPDIRSRIEARKIVSLRDSAAARDRWHARRRVGGIAALTATIVTVVVVTTLRQPREMGTAVGAVAIEDSVRLVTEPDDSARVYAEEAQLLLNRLELQRSMMRPEAVSAIDHDLRIVDSAIAEVNAAIAHDPRNPALRQLLASTYRRKVDVLRRVGNAG